MHIAIVSLGAFGHINPTLSLTTELVNAGHRVTYFTTEAFREVSSRTNRSKIRTDEVLDG